MYKDQSTDWKRSWKDACMKKICAFANAQGGRLYIGFDEDGNAVGVADVEKAIADIRNRIKGEMDITVGIKQITCDGKECIEIDVPKRPYAVSYKGVYYRRSGSTSQMLDGMELGSFLLSRYEPIWERREINCTYDDMDDGLLEHFKERAQDIGRIDVAKLNGTKEEVLESLGLVRDKELTNAAMMLFSKDPEYWHAGAFVRIECYDNGGRLVCSKEVHGSLLRMVDDVVGVVNYMYRNEMKRCDGCFVPKMALRETVANAVCHSAYEYKKPIQIEVYENQLIIKNQADLPEDWSVEEARRLPVTRMHNPVIADMLYYAGVIEYWGIGLERIFWSCKQAGLLMPEYTVSQNSLTVRLRLFKTH